MAVRLIARVCPVMGPKFFPWGYILVMGHRPSDPNADYGPELTTDGSSCSICNALAYVKYQDEGSQGRMNVSILTE